ncbi:hypothetical protein [Silvibacterium dinghuense]|uniref:Uncharacterized protein n=1 Tax=Silvibacterium dinghuense TaxID=1560006 RepID=A0A4Q1SGA1_9BACT|nr:hypothetical protein [Silvibacterium dinghuense]RXS96558.1 hypothetical protein ESZ00_00965 [Silvibacterium dinghuense]
MHCANPSCQVEAKYFRSGSLHSVDCGQGGQKQEKRQRIVWLCPHCTREWTVESWRPAGEQLRRKPHAEFSPMESYSEAELVLHG